MFLNNSRLQITYESFHIIINNEFPIFSINLNTCSITTVDNINFFEKQSISSRALWYHWYRTNAFRPRKEHNLRRSNKSLSRNLRSYFCKYLQIIPVTISREFTVLWSVTGRLQRNWKCLPGQREGFYLKKLLRHSKQILGHLQSHW